MIWKGFVTFQKDFFGFENVRMVSKNNITALSNYFTVFLQLEFIAKALAYHKTGTIFNLIF